MNEVLKALRKRKQSGEIKITLQDVLDAWDSSKLPIEIEKLLIERNEYLNSASYSEIVELGKFENYKIFNEEKEVSEKEFIKARIEYKMKQLQQFYDEFLRDANVDLTDEESLKAYIQDCVLLKEQFLQIHPFRDKNGRTSRILFNILLMKKGIDPIVHYDNYCSREQMDKAEKISNSGNYDSLFEAYYRLLGLSEESVEMVK